MKTIEKCRDLTGIRFGKLVALELVQTETRKTYWLCRCDCGNAIKARSDCLLRGNTTSCKCERDKRFVGNTYQRKHNMHNTRVFREWQGMKSRCLNPDEPCYPRYGGRGISICDEWLDSESGSTCFINWALANGYSDDLTLDRIENDGNYEPSNCRWATNKEQSNNRRSNIVVEHDGKEHTLMQLCEMLDLPYKAIYVRYRSGDRGERLIRPIGVDRQARRGATNNKSKITEETARAIKRELLTSTNCRELARKYGVSNDVVYDIKRGKTWSWI